MNTHVILFFDGVCNLCSVSVDFLLRFRSKKADFKIASLQGETALKYLPLSISKDLKLQGPSSVIVLLKDGQILTGYEAIQYLVRFLLFPLNFLYSFILWIFSPLGNVLYKWVAANRYRWFGKKSSCRLPTSAERTFFLP